MAETVLLISYWPLLSIPEFQAGMLIGSEVQKTLSTTLESIPKVETKACLWAYDNQPFIILIMERAKEVADHLIEWSDNRQSEWFNLVVTDAHGKYCVALFPNIERSIKRFEFSYLCNNPGALNNPAYQVVFQPLAFGAGISSAYQTIKPLLAEKARVGLLDIKDLAPNPMDTNQDLIIDLGEFNIDTSGGGHEWVTNFLEQLEI